MPKKSTVPPRPIEDDCSLSVQLLGIVSVRRGEQSLALPKKAQGLLAYLALERGRPVPRDLLATLFWGSTATAQARQSLRQALAALRDALGNHSSLIVADTEAVRLGSSSALVIDVTEFEAAARSTRLDDLERAEELYRGEFLAGQQIPVEPFIDWLSIERQRLSTLRADQLYRLSEARSTAGDIKGALKAARQLTTHDPLREEGHRLLMGLLASDGQRSAALKQYATFAKLLSEQLGLSPDVETAQLAERIRAEKNTELPIKLAAEDPERLPHPASGASRLPSIRGEKVFSSSRDLPLPDKPSIVILPFANLSGDASQDYFVDGLVDDITIALGREKWLFVISSPSAFSFRNRDEDPREIAAKLGVRYVLRGSVRKSGRRVRVVVLLTDAVSGEFMWSDRYEDEADNVFELNDRLIAHLAAAIAPALRSIEIDRVQRRAPASLSAFELYLQALPRVRKDLIENEHALALLDRAIALDPTYSAGYALAARCYQFQRLMGWVAPSGPHLERGAGFARLAAELGKNDSEALWMAAHSMPHLVGEVDLAKSLIDRSIALNPNSSSAWSSSCFVYTLLGQFEKAIDDFQRSQRLNPLDHTHHLHWNIAGMAHFGARQYEEANAAADKTLSLSPAYPQALRLKIAACGALGRLEEGRTFVQRLLAVHPDCSLRWLEEFNRPMMEESPDLLQSYLEAARVGGMPSRPNRVERQRETLQ